MPSFRGDAKHRTRNLEIPGLVLMHHPGMTVPGLLRRFAPPNDEKRRFSATTPATGRGFGIPFDRQNSVFAGSAAGIAGPPRRRPVVFDRSAKRRANRHAAPAESRGVRP